MVTAPIDRYQDQAPLGTQGTGRIPSDGPVLLERTKSVVDQQHASTLDDRSLPILAWARRPAHQRQAPGALLRFANGTHETPPASASAGASAGACAGSAFAAASWLPPAHEPAGRRSPTPSAGSPIWSPRVAPTAP
jgi:hypothetical protein